jgi:ubiquinone/menaquinone biosynthesis C-methylase UbiE
VAVLHPAALGEVERAEIAYWDQRGRSEVARLDEYYRENYVALDRWGMYAYLDSVRQLDLAAPILEIGAGMVPKSLYLALYEGFHDVTVSDISPVQLSENRRLCERLGVANHVTHVAADAARLPFADAAFAAVLVHSALHHIPTTAAAVAEMARCAQPGGLLIVGHEPNRRLHRWVRRVADRLRLTERHRETTYSVADEETPGLAATELIAEFRSAGVVPVAYEPHWYVMGIAQPLPLVVRRLARGWSPPLGAWLRPVARAVDPRLARVPGLRNLSFYFSLVGQKPPTAS